MPKHNWEHYHLDDENQDSKEFNEGAYGFYDFSDEEVRQMEDDRIASLSKTDEKTTQSGSSPTSSSKAVPSSKPTAARASAKERTQKFKAEIDGTQGSDFTTV